MVRRVFVSLVLLTLLARASWGEIIYSNPMDAHVTGSWEFADSDAVLVTPMNLAIDLNHDGADDISIDHHYVRGVNRIQRDAVELLQTASLGQRAVLALLKNVRSLTLEAATVANDAHEFSYLQAYVDNQLDTVNRIAENTAYNGQKLLDGSSGMRGVASNSNIRVLHVGETVQPGVHSFTVDTAAERASHVTANNITANQLGQDETLTINGVRIELSEHLTGTQVMDRINQFIDQTGVTARVIADGADVGKLRLSSLPFGQAAQIELISNVAVSKANSTGIGTSLWGASGVDLVATIAGTQFNGQGNTVTADSGATRGLTVSVAPRDHGDGNHLTFAGQLGVIHVSDESLSFPLHPAQDETVRATIRSLHSSSLGIAVPGNQYANLAEIDVTSATKARDSFRIVDSAIETVKSQIQFVNSMQNDYFLPFGEAFVEGIGLAEIAVLEGEVGLLTTGEVIGSDSRFSDEALTIGSLEFDGRDSAFIGVRLMEDDRFHYGWIRAELAEDESLIIRDFAFESVPDRHIRAGFVPEPAGAACAIAGIALAAIRSRGNRSQQRCDGPIAP